MSTGSSSSWVLGPIVDAVLILVATLVVEEAVEAWLWDHHQVLYFGAVALHLLLLPTVAHVLLSPWSPAAELMLAQQSTTRQNVLVWSSAIGGCTSFIVPGVMALALDVQAWSMFLAIFGPYVLMAAWIGVTIKLDERSNHGWSRQGTQPWPVTRPAIALLLWAYLLFVETLLLVCVGEGDPWGDPMVVSMAVFAGYLPTRIQLWFLGEQSRLELVTAVVAGVHLIFRVFANASS